MTKYTAFLVILLLAGCGALPSSTQKQSAQENKGRDSIRKMVHENQMADTGINDGELKASIEYFISKKLPGTGHPVIAATEDELSRLKAAWASDGPEHNILAERFSQADEAISDGLSFPPEGGQHNQWYQCDSCQRGLVTIDEHHHKCPLCGKIYSGFPYDNVIYNHRHSKNISRAEDAAWAWAVTGEKKYADFAAAVLTGYAERYLNYPMLHTSVNDKLIDVAAGKNDRYITAGHLQSQTLDEANLMIPVAITYDLIFDSPSLSDKQKKLIETNFIKAMADCLNAYKSGKSNWQTWHNAALLYAGSVIGDGEMIRQAINDNENGFTTQMKISVMPEGMWYENSWGYHYYTLSAMTLIAEGTRRLGINIYNYPQLKKMYLIAFDYLMSDGSLPRFGDAVQDSPRHQEVNETAYAAYGDERLLSVLSPETNWDAIIHGRDLKKSAGLPHSVSRIIEGAGHAILATDGPGRLTAALTFGPYGGFHGHYDKLSFVLFGYGKELGVDPGRAASQAYRLPIHQEWYKASTGHNVVLVDGKSQDEAGGKYLSFRNNDSYAAVTAEAGPAFENVTHKRFMLLSPNYLVIIDELSSADGKEHVFDFLYHNKGESITCNMQEDTALLEKIPAGYSYLKDVKAHRNSSGQSLYARFAGPGACVFMNMSGRSGDEIFTATGPLRDVEDRVPVIIVRRKGKAVRFATLLEPVPEGGKPSVKDFSVSEGAPFSAVIRFSGSEDHVSFKENKLENFSITRITDREIIPEELTYDMQR